MEAVRSGQILVEAEGLTDNCMRRCQETDKSNYQFTEEME